MGVWYTEQLNPTDSIPRLRVCAVSYLNTVPLVWGMLHGEQQGLFDLLFRVPAECADMVAAGAADIGIIPSFELIGRDLGIVPGVGIACRGAVRSILLVSTRPGEPDPHAGGGCEFAHVGGAGAYRSGAALWRGAGGGQACRRIWPACWAKPTAH